MDLKLPNLGEGADSGTVVNVFVKEGDQISKDQPIIELENEKAVASIPATAAGTVTRIHVRTGDKISVGQSILSLGEVGRAEAPKTATIRKLALDLGLDLSRVRGSERGGRIVLADVRAYIQRLQSRQGGAQPTVPGTPSGGPPPTKPAPEPIDFSKWGTVARKPLSPLRKVIARRMAESWNAVPRVTQFDEADITEVMALRKKYAPAYEQKGTRLTLTGFALRAVVETLKKHRIVNSSLDEAAQEIVLKEYFHLGVAVDTEAGLIVPVIRDVDKRRSWKSWPGKRVNEKLAPRS